NGPHQTGAGHPSDEEDVTDGTIPDESSSSAAESDTEDRDKYSALQHHIAIDLCSNVKHKPVHTPHHENMFDGQPAAIQAAFETALVQVKTTKFFPEDFGVHSDEWDGDYSDHEALQVGCKGKEPIVSLPVQI
ncbi:hypothetical protein JB92DRAFT_2719474, partial [Gautieria morchelliformis]